MSKSSWKQTALAIAALSGIPAAVMTSSQASSSQSTHDVLFAFEFKGSFLAFDVGAMEALLPRLDLEKIGTTIFTGSSSGAFITSFFACNGLSQESMKKGKAVIMAFDPAILNENDPVKNFKMAAGLNVEGDIKVIDHMIDNVTNGRTCVPEHPFAIAAANNEILRDTLPGTLRPANTKRLDFDTMDVYVEATGEHLGKGCTYFTNKAGAAYLTKVPVERRLCDIRLVEKPEDLVLAIRASAAEPTYFPAMQEPEPDAFIDMPAPVGRSYQGGLVMQAVVQDFKLADPGLLTVGVGGNYFGRPINRILKNIYLVDVNRRMVELNWWYDAKFEGARERYLGFAKKPEVAGLFKFGGETVDSCMAADNCHAKVAQKPAKASLGLDGADLTPLTHRGINAILKGGDRK